MHHRRRPFPICQRVAAWEDCGLSLHSLAEKNLHGSSRGKAVGFLVLPGPGLFEEVRREYPRHQECAAPLLH